MTYFTSVIVCPQREVIYTIYENQKDADVAVYKVATCDYIYKFLF